MPASAPAEPAADVAPPQKPKGPRFEEMGLPDHVLKAVTDMGFEFATPVQAATYPLARQGKDLMVQSRTGSGKTAAFGLPFVSGLVDPEMKGVQAIVLLPTRELALQVASELARIAAGSALTVVPVYGGAPMGRQIELLRTGAQIVCGTPGRVLDHLRRGTLSLDKVKCAVLDECDEMLSMGFQEDIEDILEHTPDSRQTLLFSATMPEGIQRLARRFLKQPELLKLSADNVGVQEIKHVYYAIPGVSREQELLRILKFENPKSAIIFCNTREETGRVAEFLRQQGIEAEAISSDLSQSDRERVMARMRAASLHFLVATDVAARGIDIERLSHVFNYTFPESPEIYIHRTGRTGRAGRHGTAISLIGPTEVGSFYYLKLAYKLKPEERALPSEVEIRSRREGEHLTRLRKELPAEPGGEWKGVARRLMAAADAERVVAALVALVLDPRQQKGGPTRTPVAETPRAAGEATAWAPSPPESAPAPTSSIPRERSRDRDRPRHDRARPERGERFGEREGAGSRDDRRRREERPSRPDRDRRGPARPTPTASGPEGDDRSSTPILNGRQETADPTRVEPKGAEPARDEPLRQERAAPRPPVRAEGRPERQGSPGEGGDREFWEVWKDEAGTTAPATEAPRRDDRSASRDDDRRRDRGDGSPPDTARLYINLGRKDGAGEAEIRDLLRAHADIDEVPNVEVMNTHTYVNVPTEKADAIVAALSGKSVGDRDILCEKAKPRRR
jgi:ATP-dependent RNA helicase DeaD